MSDSTIRFKDNAKATILKKAQIKMLEKKFVFADELSGIVIKDISKLIEKCKVVTFRVVNIKTQKTIGVLDFENSSCYLFKSPNKIIWNLYINNVIYEKEARKVANSIEYFHQKIMVRIIANS